MRIFLQTRQIKRKKEKKIHYKIRLIKLDEGRDEYHLTRLLISKIKLGETNRSHHRDNEVIFLHRPTNQHSQLLNLFTTVHISLPRTYHFNDPVTVPAPRRPCKVRAKQILETTHRSNGGYSTLSGLDQTNIAWNFVLFTFFPLPSLFSPDKTRLDLLTHRVISSRCFCTAH